MHSLRVHALEFTESTVKMVTQALASDNGPARSLECDRRNIKDCTDLFQSICLDSDYKNQGMSGLEAGKKDLLDIVNQSLDIAAKENGDGDFCQGVKKRLKEIGIAFKKDDCLFQDKLLEDSPLEKQTHILEMSGNKALAQMQFLPIAKKTYELAPELLWQDHFNYCEKNENFFLCSLQTKYEIQRDLHLVLTHKMSAIEYVSKYAEEKVVNFSFNNPETAIDRVASVVLDDYFEQLRIRKSYMESFVGKIYQGQEFKQLKDDFEHIKKSMIDQILLTHGSDHNLVRYDQRKENLSERAVLEENIAKRILRSIDSNEIEYKKDLLSGKEIVDVASKKNQLDDDLIKVISTDLDMIDDLNAGANYYGVWLNPLFITARKYNAPVIYATYGHELQHIMSSYSWINSDLYNRQFNERFTRWGECAQQNYGINPNQLEETFADWTMVKILTESIHNNQAQVEDKANALKQGLSMFCQVAMEKTYSKEEMQNVHPLPMIRINAIAASDPGVREILGCGETKPIYEHCPFPKEDQK